MNDEQLLDLLETRLRTLLPNFVMVLPYEMAIETAEALARLRSKARTAWNPAGIPVYELEDVPPQTVDEILEEYETCTRKTTDIGACPCPGCDVDD